MTAHPAFGEARPMNGAQERATRYEIVVKDHLSSRFHAAFPGMELEAGAGRTVLRGDFVDQAQLHGFLDRIRDFGLELVSVNALD
jgi:hypothetical protein